MAYTKQEDQQTVNSSLFLLMWQVKLRLKLRDWGPLHFSITCISYHQTSYNTKENIFTIHTILLHFQVLFLHKDRSMRVDYWFFLRDYLRSLDIEAQILFVWLTFTLFLHDNLAAT